jgi:hypothetical protein
MNKTVETLFGVNMPSNDGVGLKFTVDNTLSYVEAVFTNYTQNSMQFMSSDGENPFLINGRKPFVVNSVGFVIPSFFTLHEKSIINCLLTIGDRPTVFDGTTNPLVFKKINLPSENYELDLNEYVDMSNFNGVLNNEGAYLYLEIFETLKISMLNVPDSLNGNIYFMNFIMKITHQNG